jgi:hypothetical protein
MAPKSPLCAESAEISNVQPGLSGDICCNNSTIPYLFFCRDFRGEGEVLCLRFAGDCDRVCSAIPPSPSQQNASLASKLHGIFIKEGDFSHYIFQESICHQQKKSFV